MNDKKLNKMTDDILEELLLEQIVREDGDNIDSDYSINTLKSIIKDKVRKKLKIN